MSDRIRSSEDSVLSIVHPTSSPREDGDLPTIEMIRGFGHGPEDLKWLHDRLVEAHPYLLVPSYFQAPSGMAANAALLFAPFLHTSGPSPPPLSPASSRRVFLEEILRHPVLRAKPLFDRFCKSSKLEWRRFSGACPRRDPLAHHISGCTAATLEDLTYPPPKHMERVIDAVTMSTFGCDLAFEKLRKVAASVAAVDAAVKTLLETLSQPSPAFAGPLEPFPDPVDIIDSSHAPATPSPEAEEVRPGPRVKRKPSKERPFQPRKRALTPCRMFSHKAQQNTARHFGCPESTYCNRSLLHALLEPPPDADLCTRVARQRRSRDMSASMVNLDPGKRLDACEQSVLSESPVRPSYCEFCGAGVDEIDALDADLRSPLNPAFVEALHPAARRPTVALGANSSGGKSGAEGLLVSGLEVCLESLATASGLAHATKRLCARSAAVTQEVARRARMVKPHPKAALRRDSSDNVRYGAPEHVVSPAPLPPILPAASSAFASMVSVLSNAASSALSVVRMDSASVASDDLAAASNNRPFAPLAAYDNAFKKHFADEIAWWCSERRRLLAYGVVQLCDGISQEAQLVVASWTAAAAIPLCVALPQMQAPADAAMIHAMNDFAMKEDRLYDALHLQKEREKSGLENAEADAEILRLEKELYGSTAAPPDRWVALGSQTDLSTRLHVALKSVPLADSEQMTGMILQPILPTIVQFTPREGVYRRIPQHYVISTATFDAAPKNVRTSADSVGPSDSSHQPPPDHGGSAGSDNDGDFAVAPEDGRAEEHDYLD